MGSSFTRRMTPPQTEHFSESPFIIAMKKHLSCPDPSTRVCVCMHGALRRENGARLVSSRSGHAGERAMECSDENGACGRAAEWDTPRSGKKRSAIRVRAAAVL